MPIRDLDGLHLTYVLADCADASSSCCAPCLACCWASPPRVLARCSPATACAL